jgi:hypothetical protein
MTSELKTIDLADLWALLSDPKIEGWAPATIYEWTEFGVAIGVQVIPLGPDAYLIVSDADGYEIVPARDIDEDDLVPVDEYDEDQALRDASDLEGWFAIVGVPGSIHHKFEWFHQEDMDQADRRMLDMRRYVLMANPALGTLEGEVMPAHLAFDIKYRDGSRVYFQPRECGQGFVPKR